MRPLGRGNDAKGGNRRETTLTTITSAGAEAFALVALTASSSIVKAAPSPRRSRDHRQGLLCVP